MWTVVDFQTLDSFTQSLFADLNEVQNLNNFEISHDMEAEAPPPWRTPPAHAVCRGSALSPESANQQMALCRHRGNSSRLSVATASLSIRRLHHFQ